MAEATGQLGGIDVDDLKNGEDAKRLSGLDRYWLKKGVDNREIRTYLIGDQTFYSLSDCVAFAATPRNKSEQESSQTFESLPRTVAAGAPPNTAARPFRESAAWSRRLTTGGARCARMARDC